MQITVGNLNHKLSKDHFISQGGEGAVYVKGGLAYKIYHDPNNLIPIAKISELSSIRDDAVIKPIDIVFYKKKPVGYSMRYIKDAQPLCKLFTKAFKQRNNLDMGKIIHLIEGMRSSVHHIHSRNILIVDCNELNFLVGGDFKTVYFIDTDSYQTPSFSATAIMDSIRDRKAKTFTKDSDWFSWGIITFQMLTGIHPYKGRHPNLKTLEDRMKANISVFNSEVSMPRTAMSLNLIPYTFRVWYEQVFEKGARCAPPGSEEAVIVVDPLKEVIPPRNTKTFNIDLVRTMKEDIIKMDHSGSHPVIWTSNYIEYNKEPKKLTLPDSHLYEPYNGSYLAWLDQGLLRLRDLKNDLIGDTNVSGSQLMSREGRLYIHNGGQVNELTQPIHDKASFYVAKMVAQVLPHAAYLFPGIILQNFLGSWYASIPYAAEKCAQVSLHQIPKGARIISAKSEHQLVSITFFYRGYYHRKNLIYDISWRNCDEWDELNVQNLEPNFTVLDNEICAYLNDKEELEIFQANYTKSKDRRTLTDSLLSHDMKLSSIGTSVKFFQGNQVFSISVNTP